MGMSSRAHDGDGGDTVFLEGYMISAREITIAVYLVVQIGERPSLREERLGESLDSHREPAVPDASWPGPRCSRK